MNNSTINWFVLIVSLPMAVAFIVFLYNAIALRILFLTDRNIKKKDRFSFGLLGVEAGYIVDLPEKDKRRYTKKMQSIKYSLTVLCVCFVLLIVESILI